MTPAQLDHLRRIDALLANLLATAQKRTPGEWSSGPGLNLQMQNTGKTYVHPGIAAMFQSNLFAEEDAAFIASCAGNAEAGWRATRAAIEFLLLQEELGEEFRFGHLLNDLLAAFPNV